VPGVSNAVPNIYLRDLQAGVTRLISSNSAGAAGNNFSFSPWMSADGTAIVFESAASNLSTGDDNNLPDLFRAQFTPAPLIRVRLLPFGPGEHPSIVWTIESGKNYHVQFKNFLSDSDWQELPGNPVPYGLGENLLSDPSFNPASQRFYRILMEP